MDFSSFAELVPSWLLELEPTPVLFTLRALATLGGFWLVKYTPNRHNQGKRNLSLQDAGKEIWHLLAGYVLVFGCALVQAYLYYHGDNFLRVFGVNQYSVNNAVLLRERYKTFVEVFSHSDDSIPPEVSMARLQQIEHIYFVLRDEDRRTRYDLYGVDGFEVLLKDQGNTMAPFTDMLSFYLLSAVVSYVASQFFHETRSAGRWSILSLIAMFMFEVACKFLFWGSVRYSMVAIFPQLTSYDKFEILHLLFTPFFGLLMSAAAFFDFNKSQHLSETCNLLMQRNIVAMTKLDELEDLVFEDSRSRNNGDQVLDEEMIVAAREHLFETLYMTTLDDIKKRLHLSPDLKEGVWSAQLKSEIDANSKYLSTVFGSILVGSSPSPASVEVATAVQQQVATPATRKRGKKNRIS